jgi:osmotically-inducible protein OsmY
MKSLIPLLTLALVCGCSKDSDTYAAGKPAQPMTTPAAKNSPASPASSPAKATMPAHPNATDTSNDKADIDLQALVRKTIVDDSTLSTAGKNVVIVVKGGAVTLRGTVPTADEKTRIASLATDVAGVSNVDNQIEVKP